MTLGALADRTGGRVHGADVAVTSVTHDSRLVEPGGLFVAIAGSRADGHAHVASALERGAAAAAVQHPVPERIPQLVVADTRVALATIAASVYGDPSARLSVVGVTGTNGKTTVTHILESIADAAGMGFGLVGTVGARIGGVAVAVVRTTPEASDLQRLLAAMVDDGVSLAALEVSSHAMELHRVDAVHFSTVAFTNLSQDHLDFHHDMERYYRAKAGLFTLGRARRAVVCVDDDSGRRLAAETDLPVTTVSIRGPADVQVRVIAADIAGTTLELHATGFTADARVPLAGRFNVANAAVAAAVAELEGVAAEAIVAGIESVPEIPGRFQRIDAGQPFGVIVDYAHTPDAVAAVIGSARELAAGRVIALLGAGGDRDPQKRPLMGRALAAADVAVVTSDNPRSESPEGIVAEVASGAGGAASLIAEVDRRAAITAAIGAAGPGDVVLILGKGHETGQEIAGRLEPFDDRVEARRALAATGWGAP